MDSKNINKMKSAGSRLVHALIACPGGGGRNDRYRSETSYFPLMHLAFPFDSS